MKVKELIEKLKTFEPDKKITINVCNNNPYTNEKLFSKDRKFKLHKGMFLTDNITFDDVVYNSVDDNIIEVTICI